MAGKRKAETEDGLYLDTVNRRKLDFDFEKLCSVTLSNVNVYGCLVCGEYFQGRGKSSPAYYHSLNDDHHLFINFNNLNVYVLPEGQQVQSHLLDDIKYAVNPSYTKPELVQLGTQPVRDISGNEYLPGIIGLNNIKHNEYSNVVLQAVCHCSIVRNWFLLLDDVNNYNELVKRFTTFIKKLWSPKLFKHHISPHELLQHISVISDKQFTINEPKNPRDFIVWLLNNLHKSLAIVAGEKRKSTVISHSFQGKLRVTTDDGNSSSVTNTKFWILTLDLPPVSILQDGIGVQEIPQIRLEKLLDKYTGKTQTVTSSGTKTYEIIKYPPYLLLHINRFHDSELGIDLKLKDRYQTLVEFPLEMTLNEGKAKYKLLCNVVHDVVTTKNSMDEANEERSDWKVQMRNSDDEWFEVKDLEVTPKEKELLFLGESYIQVWELKQ
ncbi:unnamed protein product [Cyberlindnera jadinii]|uniref:Cysteine proteinase n=1 Tax=Cyberlindnera jadinii (strain ATCC 18201 / CBS 1600 / BCRC 20928 / JCM 3617 / NBRC 0987 / NRRL Y-1542) TaxID=983966 RepID=A0A0H5C3R7_CYBJN|nr:cysteine proteinase [Cyberlindnera jadinii NRRL Y-1542]ODV75417.1 cysteine proteinase [Cyberlindnera jadinii NRRL Y-1542]CEP22556.1 unnamed protein product [Cyberlindnera jadinii]